MKQTNSKTLLNDVLSMANFADKMAFQNTVLIYIASLLEEMLRLQRLKNIEQRTK